MNSSLTFEKVGECLYRNPTSKTYFARVKLKGKEIKRSLHTCNLKEARRKLIDFKRSVEHLDPNSYNCTLHKLADKFEKTFNHLAPDTRENKKRVLRRIQDDWPNGSKRAVSKIKPSEVQEFLSSAPGIASYNLMLEVTRSMFALAVKDGVIPYSPAAGLTYRKREKPIRQTPSLEDFHRIVSTIRTQKFSDTANESADFIEFLGLAGLGQAEASALCWRDVDFKRGHILTFRQKTRKGFAVPIFPQLRPLLEKRYRIA